MQDDDIQDWKAEAIKKLIQERLSKEAFEQFHLLMKASALERRDAKFYGYGTWIVRDGEVILKVRKERR
jgi:hypothetical protein